MSSTSLPYHESENDGGDFRGAPSSDKHSLYAHLPITSSRQQAPREKGNVYFIPSTAQHNRNASHHLTNGGTSRSGTGLEAREKTEQHRQVTSNKGRAQMGRETTRERIEHLGDTNRTVRGGAQRHIQYNPSAPQSLRYASVHMFNHGTSKNRTEHKCEREGKEQYIQGKQDMIDFPQCKNERKELRTEERRNFTNSKLKPFEPSHMHCSQASSHSIRNGNVHVFKAEMNGSTVEEQHEESCYEPKQRRVKSMQAYTEWDQSGKEHDGDGVRRKPTNNEHGRERHVNYDTTPPGSVRDSIGHMSTESQNSAELGYGREGNEQSIPSETDMNNILHGKDKGVPFVPEQHDVTDNILEIPEPSQVHCDPSSPNNLRNASIHIFSAENPRIREETMHVATEKQQHEQLTHNQQNRCENLHDDPERRRLGRGRTEQGVSTDGKVRRGVTLQARSERMDLPPCYLELDAIREHGERIDFTRARPERSSFTVWPSPAQDFRQVHRETRPSLANDDDINSCHWYVLGFFLGLEGIVNCLMFILSFALLMAALAALAKKKDRAFKILIVITWVSIIAGILMPVIITIAVIQGGKSSVRDKT